MIFSWYRQNADEFGFVRATWLLWRVVWRRAYVNAVNKALPARFSCPCCDWQGRRFFDYIEIGYQVKNVACPRCDSHSRHRAFFLWLRDTFHIEDKAGTALIFAPERALVTLWETAHKLRLVRIDVEGSRGIDVLADITLLPFISDSASLVWCHHVLDQVESDQTALEELKRVLIPKTGELVVSVGENAQATTREFGISDKALSGNRRAYGQDFALKLSAAGFHVEPQTTLLTETEKLKYGLTDERFYVCKKS
jgi:SAM-dependent methyltransferase